MSNRIILTLKAGALCLGFFLFAAPAQATFIDTLATFSFIEPGFPDETKAGVTVADPAIELFAGDGSAIDLAGIMTNAGAGDANGEYIDIGMDFIEFKLFGGSGTAAAAGGQTTGFGTGAKYQIDFASNVLALFEAPTLTLNNVFGVNLGTELMLASASSLMLLVDTLGVGDNFGTVRLDFELKDITPNPIPVPAALPLMLSALAALGFLTRRRKSV